jgi:hypothetical protein
VFRLGKEQQTWDVLVERKAQRSGDDLLNSASKAGLQCPLDLFQFLEERIEVELVLGYP